MIISLLIDTHNDKQTELLWKNEWGGDVKFALIPQTAEEWRFYLKIRFNILFTTK